MWGKRKPVETVILDDARVRAALVASTAKESFSYQRSISTTWDGRVEGGGTGYSSHKSKKLHLELTNREQSSRSYWFEYAQYEDGPRNILKSRSTGRSPFLRQGETWRHDFSSLSGKLALEKLNIIDTENKRVQAHNFTGIAMENKDPHASEVLRSLPKERTEQDRAITYMNLTSGKPASLPAVPATEADASKIPSQEHQDRVDSFNNRVLLLMICVGFALWYFFAR